MKAVEDDILHYKMAVDYYFSSLSPQKHDSQESGSSSSTRSRKCIFAKIKEIYVTIKYLLKQYEFWKSIFTKDILCNLNLHQLAL